MSSYDQILNIEMAVELCLDKKLAVSVIRKYVSEAVLSIKRNLDHETSFARFTLVKANYFDGWKTVYQLAEELVSKGFNLRLTVNGVSQNFSYLCDLKEKITNIDKQDIY